MTTEEIVWDPDADSHALEAALEEWNAGIEEEVIAAVAAAIKGRYIISQKQIFVYEFPTTKDVVRVPLTNISLGDLEEISAEVDNQIDTVKMLLRKLGDEKTAEKIEDQSMLEALKFAEKYFEIFYKIAHVSAGK